MNLLLNHHAAAVGKRLRRHHAKCLHDELLRKANTADQTPGKSLKVMTTTTTWPWPLTMILTKRSLPPSTTLWKRSSLPTRQSCSTLTQQWKMNFRTSIFPTKLKFYKIDDDSPNNTPKPVDEQKLLMIE